MKEKKEIIAEFQIGDILPIAMSVGIAAVGITYLLNVQADVTDDMGDASCAKNAVHTGYNSDTNLCYEPANTSNTAAVGTAEFNASNKGIEGVAKLPNKLPLIMTVVIAAIVIGILLRYLVFRGGK